MPIATGNLNDALLALVDGKFVVFRVPYPIGFFTKWMDGRIDDPNAGWKGKVAVVDVFDANDVPPRDRQGNVTEGREISASSRSAGTMRQTQQRRA